MFANERTLGQSAAASLVKKGLKCCNYNQGRQQYAVRLQVLQRLTHANTLTVWQKDYHATGLVHAGVLREGWLDGCEHEEHLESCLRV